ncbi:MAG: C39 family peptidase [Nitrospirae bacterium]|nr:C39 family peptidase [Nitrospirota bacterium]
MKKINGIRIAIAIMAMALLVVAFYSCGSSDNSSNSGTPAYTGAPAALNIVPAMSGRTSSELEQIQRDIVSEGKRWVAGITKLSGLSDEELQYYFGNDSPDDDVDANAAMAFTLDNTTLPRSINWDNISGISYVTPVKNQEWNYLVNDNTAKCGSCWAFSTTAALESYVQITTNTPGSDINLSEQILVSCSGAGSCKGGSPKKASSFLADNGTVSASCFIYQGVGVACSQACSGWFNNSSARYLFNKVNIIGGDTTATNCDKNSRCHEIKRAIANNGPVVVSMRCYSDFTKHYKSGIYSRVKSAKKEGGHAVLVVGYSDDGQYFIVKNSWGPNWGENGYFQIAYDMVWDYDATTKAGVRFGKTAISYSNK